MSKHTVTIRDIHTHLARSTVNRRRWQAPIRRMSDEGIPSFQVEGNLSHGERIAVARELHRWGRGELVLPRAV
jgi:hypothetical protein